MIESNGSDIDIYGYLQKKTSKGIYVNRYFTTSCHLLKYWHDKQSFDNMESPSEEFDIREIRQIEKPGGRQINLIFMNDKFRLDLKALSDEQFAEWSEVIPAKRSLYSVDELLVDLRSDRISLRTKTFQSLLFLKDREQNRFVLDKLDEIFNTASAEARVRREFRSDPVALLRAAGLALDELLKTCKECNIEMSSRNPKIVVHCR